MVLIQNGDEQSAEHRQNRSSPPKGPMFDRHPEKRLPPAVEKSHADQPVAYEMPGLADEVMHFVPGLSADGAEEMNPDGQKPAAGVAGGHGGRGFAGDHDDSEDGGQPVQYASEPRWADNSHVSII